MVGHLNSWSPRATKYSDERDTTPIKVAVAPFALELVLDVALRRHELDVLAETGD